MPLDQNYSKIELEVPEGSPETQIVEFRKRALEEGVPPAKIDEYLLNNKDVPIAVKQLIRKETGEVAATEVSPVSDVSPAAVEKSGAKIEGSVDVGVLSAKERMAKIKEEFGTVEKAPEAAVEGPESRPERAAQTAEGKEQTTTSATADYTQGVATRASLGVTGYAPSQQVAENAFSIAEKGDVKAAKTWQAALLQRLWEMWGTFKGLFTS
ncbi:hypothetical protein JW710_03845 [Candidatus Dojkabacteria bacterium]|nr:hypothetical protein [Candidatus Dojkabacteria bacterium]